MKIPDKKTQGLNGRHERKYTRHVFGPVPSRRLGRSLGVDLVPFKTCTYDCIYCQLGRTTCKTIERKEWVPLDDVVRELKMRLESRPDYITLSGSGEPPQPDEPALLRPRGFAIYSVMLYNILPHAVAGS